MTEYLQWTDVEVDPPKEDGLYIVRTKTKYSHLMKRGNILETNLHISVDKKGNKSYSWSCNNQVVTHYLKVVRIRNHNKNKSRWQMKASLARISRRFQS